MGILVSKATKNFLLYKPGTKISYRSLAKLSEFQAFSPSATYSARHEGLPMEVFVDLRAETNDFVRLVPQTDATFRYDKFNRLRLKNNATSIEVNHANSHLQHQTVLILFIAKFSPY